MKQIKKWTKKEFEALPLRQWGEDIGRFDSLVILPTRRRHDSGYMNMDFVSIKDDVPLCRLSGCSDVLHFDGIGGFMKTTKSITEKIEPKGWMIDCLPTSGLLRVYIRGFDLVAGYSLSSFEIFSVPRDR